MLKKKIHMYHKYICIINTYVCLKTDQCRFFGNTYVFVVMHVFSVHMYFQNTYGQNIHDFKYICIFPNTYGF